MDAEWNETFWTPAKKRENKKKLRKLVKNEGRSRNDSGTACSDGGDTLVTLYTYAKTDTDARTYTHTYKDTAHTRTYLPRRNNLFFHWYSRRIDNEYNCRAYVLYSRCTHFTGSRETVGSIPVNF